MHLGCWAFGSQPLSRVWMFMSPVLRNGEPLHAPLRTLSSSEGLLSILSRHSKTKKAPTETETETDRSHTAIGILGEIARHKPRSAEPSQKPPVNGVNGANGVHNGGSLPAAVPVSEPAYLNGHGAKYDNRWAQLLNKVPVNGKNGHHPKPVRQETEEKPQNKSPKKPHQRMIAISDDITTKLLAHKLGVSISELEQVLTTLGETPESNEDILSMDAAELAAGEFGAEVKKMKSLRAAEGRTMLRPPVVTVMGHVDHGKTTLLDSLRHTSVAAHEAGGITQHIGAFEVCLEASGETLTFLDTPGHAAFSSMRARGARVTDLVVLVVAADDGVMPQTKESLNLIKEAGCQFVVAVTKCDLPQADVERVKAQLGAEAVELEEFGGNVQLVPVAATIRQGLTELQEALLLQATNLELTAHPDVPATGLVVEANKSKGLGPVATVIVTGGTLKPGQPIVVGHHWGRIRQMKAPDGEVAQEVTPGRPVEISGLRSVPQPGDELMVVCDENRAKRVSHARLLRSGTSAHHTLSTSHTEARTVQFLVKTDTQGTGEAVMKAMDGLASEVIAPEVICHSVGNVTAADVMFAEATDAHILAFNAKVLSHEVLALAQHKHVQIHQHTVIYHLLDCIGDILLNNAPLCEDEDVIGEALVQKIFNIKCKRSRSLLSVAGCLVKSGHVQKSDALFRVLRADEVLFQGPCASLKRHKLDVDRVGKGTECGIMLEAFQDLAEGDLIQTVLKKKRQPKTESVMGGGIRVVESAVAL